MTHLTLIREMEAVLARLADRPDLVATLEALLDSLERGPNAPGSYILWALEQGLRSSHEVAIAPQWLQKQWFGQLKPEEKARWIQVMLPVQDLAKQSRIHGVTTRWLRELNRRNVAGEGLKVSSICEGLAIAAGGAG